MGLVLTMSDRWHEPQQLKVCAKIAPKVLSEDQKQCRKDVCGHCRSMQWKSPGSPRYEKARMSKSKFKVVELLDDWNEDVPSWKYPRNLESPGVSSPGFGNDSKMMVINRRSTASDLSRQLSSDTDTTISRQTVYRFFGHIDLYARRPVRCVPLTATHCRLRLTWSGEHALRTPQQWSCVMFSDESRFSLQSDSHRNLIWRAPGTRYHQENIIERHRYGGAGWLVWGGIILFFQN
ncbi:transposable element Tcb1 transposase [Trichonephila clavipes]|nr:transposable element Tcb1 transposase [Trichonephila clavipes]